MMSSSQQQFVSFELFQILKQKFEKFHHLEGMRTAQEKLDKVWSYFKEWLVLVDHRIFPQIQQYCFDRFIDFPLEEVHRIVINDETDSRPKLLLFGGWTLGFVGVSTVLVPHEIDLTIICYKRSRILG